jgi:hypothetical protein
MEKPELLLIIFSFWLLIHSFYIWDKFAGPRLDEEMSESGDSTAASVSTGIIADSHFEGYGGVSTSTSLSSSSQYHEDDDDEHSADSHAAGGQSGFSHFAAFHLSHGGFPSQCGIVGPFFWPH